MRLVEASAEHKVAFLELARDFVQAADGREGRYARALDDFEGYLDGIKRGRDGRQLDPGRVPGTEFWLVDGSGNVIGTSRLRFELVPSLEKEGGHVGYDIRPSQRGKGYGTQILALTLEKARERGLQRVRLTCDADNVASARIIEKNGGILSGQAISDDSGKWVKQYWIELA